MKMLQWILAILVCICTHTGAYELIGPRWQGNNPVVKYYLNEQGTPDVSDEFDHIHRSFDVWCKTPGTSISAEFVGPTTIKKAGADDKHVLAWQEGNDFGFDNRVIAVCYYWYSVSTDKNSYFSNFDIMFNGRDFEWATGGSSSKMDIGHIATHEVGHALGIGHSKVKNAVMYPYASSGDTTHRYLSTDDSLAITALYPRTAGNNQSPVITSNPVKEAIAGEKYTYQVTAEDGDGDSIRYSLLESPLNMKIDSISGLITWYPKFLDVGAHTVSIAAKDPMDGTGKQNFQINVTDLVVYTIDDTIKVMDTVLYPIMVTQMDEYGILAGNIQIKFNRDEIDIIGIDTTGSVLSTPTLFSNISRDTLKIAFAGSRPFTGKGTLFTVKLSVSSAMCGLKLGVRLVNATFNDGDPVACTKNGSIFAPCGPSDGFTISGKVVHSGNGEGVRGAELKIEEIAKSVKTGDDGSFLLQAVPRSSVPYTVHAAKDSGDIRDAVSAYDASLILRSIVGLVTLNSFPHQRLCADVNENDMITAYDAALILRFIVGIKDASNIGKWVMVPEKTFLRQFLTSVQIPDINAYMIGDVSGNWGDKTSLPKTAAYVQPALVLNRFESVDMADAEGIMQVRKAIISVENVRSGTYSGEIEVSLKGLGHTLHSVRALPILNGYISEVNIVNNRIILAFAGTSPLATNGGPLFEIAVKPESAQMEDSAFSGSDITYSRLNEWNTLARSAYVSNIESPFAAPITSSKINNININPVTGKTAISYSLARQQNVKATVYDMRGRLVAQLFDAVEQSGSHILTWESKQRNNTTGAQIYLLRFVCKDFIRTFKINRF